MAETHARPARQPAKWGLALSPIVKVFLMTLCYLFSKGSIYESIEYSQRSGCG